MKTQLLFCLLLVSACSEVLKPGRCDVTADCTAGEICDELYYCVLPGGDAGRDSGSDTVSDNAVAPPDAGGIDTDVLPKCTSNAQCADPAVPICGESGRCRPCSATDCKGALPFCSTSGACVACNASTDCPATTPICSANKCAACNATGVVANACANREATKTVCAADGSMVGRCVSCDKSQQCPGTTKPICDSATYECRGCSADSECVSKSAALNNGDPGVCMNHDDGRCATDAETVKVGSGNLQAAIDLAVSSDRKLVVVTENSDRAAFSGPGKLSIVGKGMPRPAVGGSTSKPGLSITSGELFVRSLAIAQSSPGVKISGGKLWLTNSEVRDNAGGGIFVDGGGFQIDSTIVTGNGPALLIPGDITWGGIRVQSVVGSASLQSVTIQANKALGLTCALAIQGAAVSATQNTAGDIGSSCGVVSCGPPSSSCGAQ